MVRYVEGLPGAAVGAADHAVIERNPIGAGALEGLAAAAARHLTRLRRYILTEARKNSGAFS